MSIATRSTLCEWLSWQETLHPNPIDLGLARFNEALQQSGWRRPRCPIVTVAGTNGKGSSVALLNRILGEAGYRVGTFTSPHLLRYNERITIADAEVSDASLIAAFERIDRARTNSTLTFFEFNALAALLVFETANLDAMILEVGLGGRLDAANAVDCDVALVTSIGLDHCDWLGHDVELIGREKAGIFRAGRPAVFGSQQMPASIAAVAAEIGAPLLRLGTDFEHLRVGDHWSWRWARSGQSGGGLGAHQLDNLPLPALVGDMQLDNAAAVLAVLTVLGSRLPVEADAIKQGLRAVRLRGRFQRVNVDGVQWILDVAHNPAAAQALASQLASPVDISSGTDRASRTIAVCAMLGDKDIEGAAAALCASIDSWIVAGLDGARAVPVEMLTQRLQGGGAQITAAGATVAAACEHAKKIARAGDRVVVFGSFLTVAGALEWLQARGVSIS